MTRVTSPTTCLRVYGTKDDIVPLVSVSIYTVVRLYVTQSSPKITTGRSLSSSTSSPNATHTLRNLQTIGNNTLARAGVIMQKDEVSYNIRQRVKEEER